MCICIRMCSMRGTFRIRVSIAQRFPGAGAAQAAGSEAQWRALVEDVWEVVDTNFMDARGAGFSRERWRQLRDEALARPLTSRAAVHGCVHPAVGLGCGLGVRVRLGKTGCWRRAWGHVLR